MPYRGSARCSLTAFLGPLLPFLPSLPCHLPTACGRETRPAATAGPGWKAAPPQPPGFKGQGIERRGGPWEGQGGRGKTSVKHSSAASDLHTCFLSPSSLLEGWGGTQHFKGKLSLWRGRTCDLAPAGPSSVIHTLKAAITINENKVIPLTENHVSCPEWRADEAVGVRQGGEGDSTIVSLRWAPFRKL